MFWTNFHSHTTFCDGAEPPESYLHQAAEVGLVSYGFSSHAPVPASVSWAMAPERLPHYLAEVRRLQNTWQNRLEIYAGLEIDFVPGLSWWDQIGPLYRELDYTIGSVHLVDQFPDGRAWEIDRDLPHFLAGLDTIFKGDVQAAVTRYYELVRWMVLLENPDIVGHMDKIKLHNSGGLFFSETDNWYRNEIEKTLKVIANMGSILEVNTRGLYSGATLDLYPSQWILERACAMRIPVTLSSDAHHPKEVIAGFRVTGKILRNIGFRSIRVLTGGKWQDVPIDPSGLGVELPWDTDANPQSA